MTVQRDEEGFLKYRIAVTNFDNTFASVASEAEDMTCTLCRFDVMAEGVKYEFKSYSASTLTSDVYGIATKQTFINQFRTYLQNPAGFQYWFNGLKGVSVADIKAGFKELYQKPNMWSTVTNNANPPAIPPSWLDADPTNSIDTEAKFLAAINDPNSKLYQHIYIQ